MISINGFLPTISKFPNHETDVKFNSLNVFKDNDIIWQFEDNSDFVELNQVVSYLRSFEHVEAINILVLYMPYERMDRYEPGKHNCFSLKAAMQMLPKGVNYVIVEPHNPKVISELADEIFVGDDITTLDYYYPTKAIVDKTLSPWNLNFVGTKSNTLVVFPDKGAKARYEGMYEGYTTAYGEKKRNFDTHAIEGYDFITPEGIDLKNFKYALVVDDLISYGGTFIKLGNQLRDIGFNQLALVAGHSEDSVFKGDLLLPDIEGKTIYDTIFTTDTMANGIDMLGGDSRNGDPVEYPTISSYNILNLLTENQSVQQYEVSNFFKSLTKKED